MTAYVIFIKERTRNQGELDLSKERDIQNFFQEIGEVDHLVFTAGDTLQLNMLEATDLTKARHAFELRYWAALAAPVALFTTSRSLSIRLSLNFI